MDRHPRRIQISYNKERPENVLWWCWLLAAGWVLPSSGLQGDACYGEGPRALAVELDPPQTNSHFSRLCVRGLHRIHHLKVLSFFILSKIHAARYLLHSPTAVCDFACFSAHSASVLLSALHYQSTRQGISSAQPSPAE